MTFSRAGFLIPLIVVVSSGLYLTIRFSNVPPVDTNVLSLLPAEVQDPIVAAAMTRASGVAARNIVLMVDADDAAVQRKAVRDLEEALLATGIFQSAAADGQVLWRWLHQNRDSLLCWSDRVRLADGAGSDIKQAAIRQWYSAFSPANARLMQTDPLLLTPRLLDCLSRHDFAASLAPSDNIITGLLTASAFRLDVQDKISTALSDWRRKWVQEDVSLSRAGAVFHAAAGAQTARTEVSLIGGITTAAVIVLFWLVFASPRAPALALFVVLSGLTTGLAVTLTLFDRIHIMAVVFGAALIGVTVDYAIHYLVTGLQTPAVSPGARRAHIFRGLSTSMATSAGAFACLLLFPVPAFRQIATIGSVGLIAAWMTTLVLLPLLTRGQPNAGLAAGWLDDLAPRILVHYSRPPIAASLAALAAIVFAVGVAYAPVLDDVRQFQKPSTTLLDEEARIGVKVGSTTSVGFFVVNAGSQEAVAEREEALLDLLRSTPDQPAAFGASDIDPSPARRLENQALIKAALVGPYPSGIPGLTELEVEQAYKTVDHLGKTAMPEWAASLRGQTGPIFWSVVPLSGVARDIAPLIEADSHWLFVDPAQRYSDLLAHYRKLATFGLAVAVLPAALVLLLSYRRAAALRILVPPLTALAVTPVMLALLGLPYSFFAAIGLFVVLGAGIDFAIFQWEHPGVSGRWTRVGILLAALTSGMAMGLLGASSVFPVQAFGITVAVGIFICLILSPLARPVDVAHSSSIGGRDGL